MTADELKAARKELGWTQLHLVALIGVDKRSVSRWETGAVRVPRSVETLVYLTRRNWALRKNIDALLDELAHGAPHTLDTKAAGQLFRSLLDKEY